MNEMEIEESKAQTMLNLTNRIVLCARKLKPSHYKILCRVTRARAHALINERSSFPSYSFILFEMNIYGQRLVCMHFQRNVLRYKQSDVRSHLRSFHGNDREKKIVPNPMTKPNQTFCHRIHGKYI